MCTPGRPAVPSSAGEAVRMAQVALAWLAGADAGSLPAAMQADCLRGLEQAAAMAVAAQASVLSAFTAQAGFEDDGHGSARTWLKWQSQVTGGAAAGAMGWARRLGAHPLVARSLAAGTISPSWARLLCEWSDLLPDAHRADADQILLAAAAGGAELTDLAALAEEMRRRTASADRDPGGSGDEDGFADRSLRLERTYGGAGRLGGDLTPQCTAAVQAVLDALGKKAGPEDTRTRRQRDHDALEEAMRRLIAAGGLPERAGQPTQIMLHMTLDQLRGPGGEAERGWASGRAGSPAGPGADCDAAIVPIVFGHADPDVLNSLVTAMTRRSARGSDGDGDGDGTDQGPAATARQARAERAARLIILRQAAELMSGPSGLAAYLRSHLDENLVATPSLPLDVGAITETIPVHLRRAVIARDRHCRFPDCDQPAAACQPHHIMPRSEGGPTSLANMILMCTFHHLIAVHRWGWGITLHADGTVTAARPDQQRILRGHGPPGQAA